MKSTFTEKTIATASLTMTAYELQEVRNALHTQWLNWKFADCPEPYKASMMAIYEKAIAQIDEALN